MGRRTRARLLSRAPSEVRVVSAYNLLEHPAPHIESLTSFWLGQLAHPPRFLWLEEKNFTQP